jgi:hypothetical protein
MDRAWSTSRAAFPRHHSLVDGCLVVLTRALSALGLLPNLRLRAGSAQGGSVANRDWLRWHEPHDSGSHWPIVGSE